jgi:hypothetical protein
MPDPIPPSVTTLTTAGATIFTNTDVSILGEVVTVAGGIVVLITLVTVVLDNGVIVTEAVFVTVSVVVNGKFVEVSVFSVD